MLHNQLWISLSRHRTAKGNNRIVDKGIEFEQVDRERNWDDQIIFNGIIFYIAYFILPGASHMPLWRVDGVVITILLHTGPVEFLYYWLHRALHHHYLYSRYHSHHHSSIVTEPITCFTLHHTQFRTNYSLFMPFYDYMYGTMDRSSDVLYEKSLTRPEESPDGEELNLYGKLYIHLNPKLKIKVVDGSSLAVAVVLNSIPKGTTQVLFRGKLSKVAYFTAIALCQKGIQVTTFREEEHKKIKMKLNTKLRDKLALSKNYAHKIWLVGDGLTEEEQLKAPKGTLFIPFSQFPPKRMRKDCFYHTTPAMMSPTSFENMDSCENWLPRRAMSAWRVAGILHALEGWNVHECGHTIFDIEKIWEASFQHGFRPLMIPS
ncbi:hypothetical protein VitviT2T_023161 [Vitis vinifera]|uniref:Very-long-chain aldehyde decarbonylase CER1-like C-terminal domain-containing protein n=1 Tax=Vitis vinifera TaxID=29760 RepID=A0ABY9DDC6_VITVI|nr:hypothetical protein VitviT2T_023161 [Vitis vinifera]